MHYKKPIIVFNFNGISLEYDSIKTTSRCLGIGQEKIKRGIEKGKLMSTCKGKVFMDYKIEDFEDE